MADFLSICQQSSARTRLQMSIVHFILRAALYDAQDRNFVNDAIDVAVDSINDIKNREGNIVLKQ